MNDMAMSEEANELSSLNYSTTKYRLSSSLISKLNK